MRTINVFLLNFASKLLMINTANITDWSIRHNFTCNVYTTPTYI